MSKDGDLIFCMKTRSERPSKNGDVPGWLHIIGSSPTANGRAKRNGHAATTGRVRVVTGPEVRHALFEADGTAVAVHGRRPVLDKDGLPDKDMWWELPDGTRNLKGRKSETLPLYGAERLPKTDQPATVFVCEGEPATDAVLGLGLFAVGTVTGADTIPSEDVLRVLVGFDVCLWPDNDEKGRRHMARIAQRLLALEVQSRVLTWSDAPAKGDAVDFRAAGLGVEQLRVMYKTAVLIDRDSVALVEDTPAPPAASPMTDLGNAQRLVNKHGQDIRWCDAMGRWFHWNGVLWEQVGPTILQDLAKETALALYDEAAEAADAEQRIALMKWAKASGAARAISSMVALTKTVTGSIAVDADQLDADPMLLGVENGVVDLRTGKGRPSDRADLITKSCRTPFDPDAACSRWDAFLSSIFAGNADVIAYIQRAVGYSLTGKTSERVIFIEHGSGANGKTTFIEVLAHILGTYAMSTPIETLIVRKDPGISNDIARLKSARFVSAVESERGVKLAEAKIKQITGGDRLAARFLHQEFFEFLPQCKMWLATNHRPEIAAGGKAIWKRVRLLPFEVEFTEDQIDPDIKAKLLAEVRGILAWAVRGCLEWQRIGLREPDYIRAVNAGYEEDEDVLGAFLEDRAEVKPNVWVSVADLYKEFESWRDAHGEEKLSAKAFSQAMVERKGIKRSRQGPGGTRGFSGVRLPDRVDPKRKRQPDGLDE